MLPNALSNADRVLGEFRTWVLTSKVFFSVIIMSTVYGIVVQAVTLTTTAAAATTADSVTIIVIIMIESTIYLQQYL